MVTTGTSSSRLRYDALLGELEAHIESLTSSKKWAAYLAAQARFHRYSARNVLLISMQRPDATHVAGYRVWADLGRHVRRGERSISILAPMISSDEEVRGFRWVHVFDLAQTDGEPLPSPVRLLDQEPPVSLEHRLEAAARSYGLSVVHTELPSEVNGELRWATSTIALHAPNPALQRAKTIAHEIGHFLLHRHESNRARAEIEAEAIAFIVLASQGADTSSYSAGYVASWLRGADDPSHALARSCEAIQRTASEIIDRVERSESQGTQAGG